MDKRWTKVLFVFLLIIPVNLIITVINCYSPNPSLDTISELIRNFLQQLTGQSKNICGEKAMGKTWIKGQFTPEF